MNDFGGTQHYSLLESILDPIPFEPFAPARQVGIAHSLCHRESSDTPLLRHALSPKRAFLALHEGASSELAHKPPLRKSVTDAQRTGANRGNQGQTAFAGITG